MVTFSVIFNSNSSSSKQDKSNNSDKFGNDIMCGAWLLNNAEELGWCSLSCSISCYYFILHLWKKIIDYFLNINSTIFLGGAIDHDHTLKLGIWIGIAAALVQFQTDTFLMDLLKKYALFFVINRWYFKFFWFHIQTI